MRLIPATGSDEKSTWPVSGSLIGRPSTSTSVWVDEAPRRNTDCSEPAVPASLTVMPGTKRSASATELTPSLSRSFASSTHVSRDVAPIVPGCRCAVTTTVSSGFDRGDALGDGDGAGDALACAAQNQTKSVQSKTAIDRLMFGSLHLRMACTTE